MNKQLNKSTITLLLLAIIATGCMGIGAYQARRQGADELNYYASAERANQSSRFDERVLSDIFSQTMTGYFQLKKSQDSEIKAYDVFIPDQDEESDQALRESISDYYSETSFDPNTQGGITQYIIQDTTTKKTFQNTSNNMLSDLLADPETQQDIPWYILFQFDDKGNISFPAYKFLGDSYSSEYMGTTQNLIDLYDQTLRNSQGFALRSELGEDSTNLVKNATFLFSLNQSTIDKQIDTISNSSFSYDTYTDYASPYCYLIILCLSIAVYFSTIHAKELPAYRFIRKIPYEVHLILILCVITFISSRYNTLYYLSADFLSISMLFPLIQVGIIYLYIGYLNALIKENYREKSWKPYFISRSSISFLMNMDLSKIDNIRALILTAINFLVIIFFVALGSYGGTFLVLAFLYSILIFFVAYGYLTKVRKDYRNLLDITKDISTGDFNSDIDRELGIFNDFKNDIVNIRANFKHAVEEEVHSQKMKTELISNVSHDLKTPLTSIITYTDLLKKDDLSEKDRKKYLNTLDRNAIRLKHLIEDLFEVSKANSGNIKLEKMAIDICSLMMQVQVELADKFHKAKLEIRNDFAKDKIMCMMDPQKTYRIFENLLSNITKYAMPSTRVYINITEVDKYVEISLRNISATELNFNAEDITERFMRGDKSRNTEGSGLGLAIAKTFSELHDGKLDIYIDGDLFKVILKFPNITPSTTNEQPQE